MYSENNLCKIKHTDHTGMDAPSTAWSIPYLLHLISSLTSEPMLKTFLPQHNKLLRASRSHKIPSS